MEELKEELRDLHKLFSVTKDFNHIIEYQPGSWKMFEPSKFVYSYFTFNTLYSYDWPLSIYKLQLKIHQDEIIEEQKFKRMIDFIFENQNEIKSSEFIEFLLQPNKKKGAKTKESLKKALKHITSDNNISETERDNFIKEFAKLIDSEIIRKGKLKILLRFIYNVRNNIFHGTKNTIEMTDPGQRKRLEIYSNLLNATNNLLFKSLEKKLNFKLDENYKIKL